MSITQQDTPSRWLRFPDGPAAHEVFDDFDGEVTISTTDTDAAPWAGDAIASGTAVMTVDEDFGIVRFANSGSNEDSGYQIQRDIETVALRASKEARFMCRLKASLATESSFFTGLAITDTTIQHATTDTLAGGLTISDGIGFYKPDGEATIYGVVIRDSVQLAVGPLAVLSDATYVVLSYLVDMSATNGQGRVRFFVDKVEKGQIDSSALPYGGEEILAPSFAWKSGSAAAATCDVDYIGVLVER